MHSLRRRLIVLQGWLVPLVNHRMVERGAVLHDRGESWLLVYDLLSSPQVRRLRQLGEGFDLNRLLLGRDQFGFVDRDCFGGRSIALVRPNV